MVAQVNPIVIRGNVFDAALNRNAEKGGYDHVVDFSGTANGAFRTLQLLDKTSRLAAIPLKNAGNPMGVVLEGAAGRFSAGWMALAVVRLPDVSRNAWNAVSDIFQPAAGKGARSYIDNVGDISDCAATWAYSALLVKYNPAWRSFADVASLVSDTSGLSGAAQDVGLAGVHWNAACSAEVRNGAVEQRFKDTMIYSLLKVVKSATSVFGGVLGLLVLTYGGPVLPAFALIGVGLVGTISAVASYFFKETRENQLVNFTELPVAVV